MEYIIYLYGKLEDMNELQILFRLNELDKKIPLELAIEVMGRVIFTKETLEEEGHEYDEDELIKENWDWIRRTASEEI